MSEQPRKRILVAYGTRPEAVKLAPVIQRMRESSALSPVVAVTGQHNEMLAQINDFFGIVPAVDLKLMRIGQSLDHVLSTALLGIGRAIRDHEPSAVLVQGDTTSVLAASLAAFHAGVPVAHLEAGLRSFDLGRPFPEEANRVLVSRLARLNLAPTETAASNLRNEGVPAEKIVVTGNTGIDALLAVRNMPPRGTSEELRRILEGPPYILLTAHRRENRGDAMREIALAVRDVARARRDLGIAVSLHPAPGAAEVLSHVLCGEPNVTLLGPVDYIDFVRLMAFSQLVLTDSGGVQEEAPTLGVPVLVLRETTERPEAVEAGASRLIGCERDAIFTNTMDLLADEPTRRLMGSHRTLFGDGQAASRVIEAIADMNA